MNIFEAKKLKLKKGTRIRVYLSHITCHDTEVREGIITNTTSHKRSAWNEKESALQLKVERAGGILRFGEVDYRHRRDHSFPYTRSYFYSAIVEIEDLSQQNN